MKLRGKILVGLAALGLIGGGLGVGEAFASIPDGSGIIHACYENAYGITTIIDNATQSCPAGSTSITWNQAGPTGATGATGATGPAGSSLSFENRTVLQADWNSISNTAPVQCNSGEVLVNAWETSNTLGLTYAYFSSPATDNIILNGSNEVIGRYLSSLHPSQGTTTVELICATP